MREALVVGGTGPTGPYVISGLLDRGYEVTAFHGGFHEADLPEDVRHLHGDPHFPDTIKEALGDRSYDVVLAQYGRLKHIVDHFRGRTGHLVAVGSVLGLLAGQSAPSWGMLGRPQILDDELPIHFEDDPSRNKLGYRVAQAARHVLEADARGEFTATYIGYPNLYGPRQPGPREWSIVRRILDGRRQIILADNGLKLESRGYVENVALAPLLAIDSPTRSGGKLYSIADSGVFTVRQWVEAIASYMGHSLEVIDMPYPLAKPCHPLYRNSRHHQIANSTRARRELGYADTFTSAESLSRTVDWLSSNQPTSGGEAETQLGDPFDYDAEDVLIAEWNQWNSHRPPFEFEVPDHAHVYRHPDRPNQRWSRPVRGRHDE